MDLELDEKDKEIMRILQKDANKSYRGIGRELGCPITTVYSRVKRLEERGVVIGYKTIFNAVEVGFPATAFILVRVKFREAGVRDPYDFRRIANEIAKLREVQKIHMMAGEWDFIVKIKVEDTKAAGRCVMDKLRLIVGVERSLTYMVFETVKESGELPI
jgi:Lrp/AsnC family leucine-responsive transcriptional regulator